MRFTTCSGSRYEVSNQQVSRLNELPALHRDGTPNLDPIVGRLYTSHTPIVVGDGVTFYLAEGSLFDTTPVVSIDQPLRDTFLAFGREMEAFWAVPEVPW